MTIRWRDPITKTERSGELVRNIPEHNAMVVRTAAHAGIPKYLVGEDGCFNAVIHKSHVVGS